VKGFREQTPDHGKLCHRDAVTHTADFLIVVLDTGAKMNRQSSPLIRPPSILPLIFASVMFLLVLWCTAFA
jgi:hypothetical protein